MNTQLICYTAPNDLIARWGLAVVLFIILCVLETAIKNNIESKGGRFLLCLLLRLIFAGYIFIVCLQ